LYHYIFGGINFEGKTPQKSTKDYYNTTNSKVINNIRSFFYLNLRKMVSYAIGDSSSRAEPIEVVEMSRRCTLKAHNDHNIYNWVLKTYKLTFWGIQIFVHNVDYNFYFFGKHN